MRAARRWFEERLGDLPQSLETKAYVVSVFTRFVVTTADDMSDESVVLSFKRAQETADFGKFQRIGDWVLWVETFMPDAVKNKHQVVETFGRLAYSACFRLLKRQWPLYEELADELPRLTYLARKNLLLHGIQDHGAVALDLGHLTDDPTTIG